MASVYPLRFVPVYQNYIWGGRRLETVLGRQLGGDGVYAESWDVADHDHGQSVVEAGPLAGTSLRQLTADHGEALFGKHDPQTPFPLLLKFLDACRNLSVQVHPDDETAKRMGLSDPGKTEAWLIVEAEPGSKLWAGFNFPMDRELLDNSLQNGDLEQYLHVIEPKAGDCIFIPAGTVHALGAGLLVAEIQQTSDNTFRLFDWNRLGDDGKPRQLHIEESLEATDYGRGPVGPCQAKPTDTPGRERLVECPQFVLDRWRIDKEVSVGGDGRFHILTLIEGTATASGDPAERPLVRGETILLPAECEAVELTTPAGTSAVVMDTFLP